MKTYDLLTKLNISRDLLALFVNSEITSTYSTSAQLLTIELPVVKMLPFRLYQQVVDTLKNKFNVDILLTMQPQQPTVSYVEVMKFMHYIVSEYKLNNQISNLSTRLVENQLIYITNNDGQAKLLRDSIHVLNLAIEEVGLPLLIDIEQTRTRMELNTQKEFEIQTPKPKPVVKKRPIKTNDYTLVSIHQLIDEAKNVKVSGVIFQIDERVTKLNSIEVTVFIYHENDALEAKAYLDADETFDAKVGQSIMLYGYYSFDNYHKENRFRFNKYEVISDLYPRIDDSDRKRIELHAHTQASEMDGISKTSDLVEQAYKFGHDAIAITDHMVVHSYPTAQKTANALNAKGDHKIKVIYGVEMNMVADHFKVINKTSDESLLDATYIVFDIETTGLSSRYDEIIEFGGVKIENQSVVSRLQFFVKPNQPLPANIEKLTGITQNMVNQGISLEEGFKKIKAFIGDDILVAHNASFDMRFLQQAALNLNEPALTNTVLDTLDMSRLLLNLKRSYALGSVARHFRIAYDQSIAHRADYDAEVLASVLNSLLSLCYQESIVTFNDLSKLQETTPAYDKAMKFHVNVLAKNHDGLKAIYELVTLSHTEYLRSRSSTKTNESNGEPRIPRSEISRLRKNLLIGSACYNSLLFDIAKTGSRKELEEEMAFYDYVEIQPIEQYTPLLYTNNIKSRDQLISILKDIIEVANKLNKPVVASGDVHYINEEDKVFRDVYIQALGLGGVRHPLYVYDQAIRHNNEVPTQHFRTTQEMMEGYPYLDRKVVETMVIDNPKHISDMISEIQPIPDRLFTPKIEGSDEKLKEICYNNAHKLYGNPLPKMVSDRLERELTSIISNGYGVIYYTSYLLVNHSLKAGYMVGSRGSIGSSFVATMSEITEVNPLAPHYVCSNCHYHEFFVNGEVSSGYDLEPKACPDCGSDLIREGQNIPFETFLGFQGDKVPDIDLNFSSDFQEQAHAYTKDIFGEDKVLRAGTISTIAEKTAFGHVSGYFEEFPERQTAHGAYKEYLTQGAAGVKRSTGQHPGGIIVIPQDKDVFDFTPFQYPANNVEASWKTTHFEFGDIHDNVLKLDILGHVDPTAMKYLEKVTGVDISTIPMNDPDTMSLFSTNKALMIDERRALDKNGAVGLPEFGTSFVRGILDDTQPTQFSDLVRISGLSHGTQVWAGNADDLIKNQGLTLQHVIACRDDIMTDLMRQGLEPKMAFNIMESVRKGRGLLPEWIETMNENKIPSWYIDSCLKIQYLFPKAHAVAYCMMGYRVAWFKVHHPLAFYGQFFTLRCDAYEIETLLGGTDVILARINDINSRRYSYNIENKVTNKEISLLNTLEVALEMTLRGFNFTPLDLHTSPAVEFLPDPNNEKNLLIPFVALDGLGAGVAHSVVAARKENDFISLQDVQQRTGLNQTLINVLKKHGAVGELQETNQMSFF